MGGAGASRLTPVDRPKSGRSWPAGHFFECPADAPRPNVQPNASRRLDGLRRADTEGMLKLTPALALAMLSLTLAVARDRASAVDPVLDAEEKAFCTKINKYRAQNGRAPLQVSVSLTNASKWMSNDMAIMNYFSHTDSLGRTFSIRLAAFGYTFSTAKAENIAAGNSTANATFEQWRIRRPQQGHAQHVLQGHRHRPRLQRRVAVPVVLDDRLRRLRRPDDPLLIVDLRCAG